MEALDEISTVPERMPYDAKSHRALEHSPKFAREERSYDRPLGVNRRDDDDPGWGPTGVSRPGFGYFAGR